MINLAVINLKNVFRGLIKIIIVAIIVTMIFKFVKIVNFKNYINSLFSKVTYNYVGILESNISVSNYLNNKDVEKFSSLKKILVSELAVFATEEELMEKENQEEIIDFAGKNALATNENGNGTENADIATLGTVIIETNNRADKFTNNYGNVKIKNESSYELTEAMITPDIDFKNKKDIVIYHTHTCEAYTQDEANRYTEEGKYRTTNLNYNIARVGTELTNILTAKGYNVVHNKTIHDYPAFSGSYTRSLNTAKNVLSGNSAELVFDVHRDALGNNEQYAPTVKIGDETVAQIMFVIGTNGGGLEHTYWNDNLKLAIKIQEKANEMYPGLFRAILLRDSRYNQNVARGANIIEVGATGNTLEQCLREHEIFRKCDCRSNEMN